MKKIIVPEFQTYEEEADFWDNLDPADFMDADEDWFRFDTPQKRAVNIPILPELANELSHRAHDQGVSIETLVNVFLLEHLRETMPNAS